MSSPNIAPCPPARSRFQRLRTSLAAAAALLSLLLLRWSFRQLEEVKLKSRAANQSIQSLARDMDQFHLGNSLHEASQMLERLKIEQRELLLHESKLTNWIRQLEQRVLADGFDLKSRFGPVTPVPERPGIATCPLQLDVTAFLPPSEKGAGSAYDEVLHLCQNWAESPERIDVVHLEFQDGGESGLMATARLNLWIGRSQP